MTTQETGPVLAQDEEHPTLPSLDTADQAAAILSQNKKDTLGRNDQGERFADIMGREKLEAISTYLNPEKIRAVSNEVLYNSALTIEKIEVIGKYMSVQQVRAFDSFYLTQDWATPVLLQAIGEHLSPGKIEGIYRNPRFMNYLKDEAKELDREIIRAIGLFLSEEQVFAIGGSNFHRFKNINSELLEFIGQNVSLKLFQVLNPVHIINMGQEKLSVVIEYLSISMMEELGSGHIYDLSIEIIQAIGKHLSPSTLKKICGGTQAGSFFVYYEESKGEILTPEVIERLGNQS